MYIQFTSCVYGVIKASSETKKEKLSYRKKYTERFFWITSLFWLHTLLPISFCRFCRLLSPCCLFQFYVWKRIAPRNGERLSPAPECLQPCAAFNSRRWFEKKMTNVNIWVRYPHIYSSYSSQFRKLIWRESENVIV